MRIAATFFFGDFCTEIAPGQDILRPRGQGKPVWIAVQSK